MFASQTEIDTAIDELISQLAMPKGMDAAGMIKSYGTAMDGFTASVIQTTVKRILRGEFEGVNQRFMPMGPELSSLLRKVEREAVQSAHLKSYSFPPPEARSPFERRQAQAGEQYKDWKLVDENLSLDEFGRRCKRLQYPLGSKWVPILNGNVYAPPAATGHSNGHDRANNQGDDRPS